LEIEEGTGGGNIVKFWLIVESDVVSSHWAMVHWFSGATEGLDSVVEVWHEAFDSLIFVIVQALSGCGCDETLLKIPSKVIDDCGNHMKINNSLKKLVGSGMNTVIIEGVTSGLKHKSFSKSMSESEDIVTNQGGPDLKEFLSFRHHKVLQLCFHVIDFNSFFHVNQILESHELCDVVGCG